MEISISGPGIVSVNSEELVKTPEAQRQIKAAHGLDKSLRKQVSEIESLRATISRLEAELAEVKRDAERYRHLLSEAYVFGRTPPDIHNIPDEPVSLWLHSTVPLDVEGINGIVDAARKGEEEK